LGIKKYVGLFDAHYGRHREHPTSRPLPIHNQAQIDAVLAFVSDFKPDVLYLGGDMVDCGPISHWNKKKKLSVEGLRLGDDFDDCKQHLIDPLTRMLPRTAKKIYQMGNHEDWIDQFIEEHSGLAGMVSVDEQLDLTSRGFEIIQQGDHYELGKMLLMHGDTLGASEHIAKKAVLEYETSVRFGHVHTLQQYTKTSRADASEIKTGVAVPCLCSRRPGYGKGSPNRWINGFVYGYVNDDGTFNDYAVVIVGTKFVVNGKLYKG
jgi:UDP-2,3-diacylglucosamine pyrophosphatase LpxH